MIKHYYVYKNDKIGTFNDIFTQPYNAEDMKQIIKEQTILNKDKNLHLEELSLYKFGDFDDKSGKMKIELEFLMSLSEFTENGK